MSWKKVGLWLEKRKRIACVIWTLFSFKGELKHKVSGSNKNSINLMKRVAQ